MKYPLVSNYPQKNCICNKNVAEGSYAKVNLNQPEL